MIYTYEIRKIGGPDGSEYIYRIEDGTNIPIDIENADYQLYLKSLEGLNGDN
jgi:hypothetical protein